MRTDMFLSNNTLIYLMIYPNNILNPLPNGLLTSERLQYFLSVNK